MKLRRLLRSTLSVVLAASFLSAISIESASAAAACSPTSITANNFTYLYFKTATTCDWTVPAGVSKLDVLIVAGGGAGGIGTNTGNEAGGGGAGGFIENLGVAVTPGSVNSIVVGAGGTTSTPSNGGDSSALGYIAKGGGHGASGGATLAATQGGSGGGGSCCSYNAAASNASGQGNSGGTGVGSGGGGGGGAGSAGGNANGGFGKQSVITSLYYAGGGSAWNTGKAYHGGGTVVSAVENNSTTAQNGVDNTGGGGAGGYSNASKVNNGAGGSGIVVIRYYTAVESFSAIDTVTVNVTNAFVPLTTSSTAIDATGFTGNVGAAIRTTNALFKIGATAAGNLTANTGYSSSQFTSGTDTETAFYGTLAQVNAALDTISVSVSGANARIQIALFPAGYSYNFDNGHLYKMVTLGAGVYWEYARCASLFDTSTITNSTTGATDCTYTGAAPNQKSVLGLSGYISNISSLSEVNFALNKAGIAQLTTNAWLGGSDTATAPIYSSEGNFMWMDGPESRKIFRDSGCTVGTVGTCPNAAAGYNYNNWSANEPNNSGGNESYLQIGNTGTWNDCANSCTVQSYLVEYGNTGESLYTQDSIALQIATAAPVISLPGNATTANKLIQTTITASVAAPGTVTFYYKGQVIGKCKNRSVTGTAPNLSYGCIWKPVIQGQQVISVAYSPTDSANLPPATSNLTILVGKRTGAR